MSEAAVSTSVATADPRVGACPPWCEEPCGHDWEDERRNGPVRIHTWRRRINEYHAIAVEEIEQVTASGTVRHREVVLDVEAPTQWDIPTAEKALCLLAEAIGVAHASFPADDCGVAH